MSGVLMTICTYDDPAVAEVDAKTLRAAGIKANVAKCLYKDPDNPGVPLVDLVVDDRDVKRSQEILGLLPPEGAEKLMSEEAQAANRRMAWGLAVLAVLTVIVAILSFWK